MLDMSGCMVSCALAWTWDTWTKPLQSRPGSRELLAALVRPLLHRVRPRLLLRLWVLRAALRHRGREG